MSVFWTVIGFRPLEEIEETGASEKKIITREQWKEKLDDIKIRKEDMNKLVMDFLVVEGFIEAAEKFCEESGTQPDVDLATITDRVAIIRAVQCGNIEDAMEKLHALNPEILIDLPRTNSLLFYQLKQQWFLELIRNGRVEEAVEFAQDELAPLGEENEYILQDLERTFSLLAFKDVSNCPRTWLLDVSRCLKRAREVNAVILTSQGHDKDPKIRSLAKMLTWVQMKLETRIRYSSRLHSLGLPFKAWTRHSEEQLVWQCH